jgi:hypothetical protein
VPRRFSLLYILAEARAVLARVQDIRSTFRGNWPIWPILTEALKMALTRMIPPSLCSAMAAKPINATHPHEAQSEFPPN